MKPRREKIESLCLENMGFRFDSGECIFEGVSFELPQSRMVWIRSPGGRGKSTLLRILACLEAPTSGQYLINGRSVANQSFEDLLPIRLNMGYGFDNGGLMNNKTLADNLTLQLKYHSLESEDEINERVESVAQLFGISGQFLNSRPYAVPGSIRKLVCILRTFMHWPQVVFLDDPTTGLKADNLNDLLHFVDESFGVRGLKTVFYTGENPAFAQRFGAEEVLISTDWFTTRMAA